MVLGVLKPILSPLLPPAAPNADPNSAVGRAAAAQQAAREAAAQQAAAQQQNAQQAQPEGVTFDLSDKALQLVEDAAAAQSLVLPPATQAPSGPVAPSAAPQTQPASTAAAAAPAIVAPRTAPVSVRPAAEPVLKASDMAARQPAEASDPTEEERARAWAIRGMEREKLLSLVETLKVNPKADPAQKEVAEHTAAQPLVQAAPSERTAAV
ncbi:hypothetical protein [Paracoccus everestensis]|uniref:hypothetical protein n=1 Tax=Paracoccus everestensis TaxID=2903900 RepID=UPI001F38EE2A|nr:hypothetical protein [Paracoccus everestensis]